MAIRTFIGLTMSFYLDSLLLYPMNGFTCRKPPNIFNAICTISFSIGYLPIYKISAYKVANS